MKIRPESLPLASGVAPLTTAKARFGALLSGRPFAAFVALAYLWSWLFWTVAALTPDPIDVIAHYVGGFGPLLAAMVVVRTQGGSVIRWVKGLFIWRVSPAWYVFVLGFPALLVTVTSFGYLLLGYSLDLSVGPSRLLAYVPTLLLLVAIGGGNEEPGWRGFGLGESQQTHGPILATLILGSIWALWHLPLLATSPYVMIGGTDLPAIATIVGVTFASITAHSFWYTWVINRTGSVLLCMLLHGGYNAANGLLLLVPRAEVETNYAPLLIRRQRFCWAPCCCLSLPPAAV